MDLLTIDFETYYSRALKYSLSSMSTEEYLRDPRFQTLLVGIKRNDEPTHAFLADEHDLELVFDAYHVDESACLFHHAHFDAAILNWHYGKRPRIILDTLAMARAGLGSVAASGLGLGPISEHLGVGHKGDTVNAMDGMHLADLSADGRVAYANYCALSHDSDVNLTYRIYQHLAPQFTRSELKLIDITTRLFTEPMLVLDGPLYEEFKRQEVARKGTLLLQAGLTKDVIMSSPKFAEALQKMGVKPPMKPSPKKKDENGKPVMIHAFAKSDDNFKALLEHPDEYVRYAVEARLGVKTSIMETRAQRFADMARRGAAPIYIKYWGAEQTGRHSAGDKTNFLNLGRARPLMPEQRQMGVPITTPAGWGYVAKVSSNGEKVLVAIDGAPCVHEIRKCHQLGLRDGLRAPPGFKIVVGDSSNIEARKVVYIAEQTDILEGYRRGEDQYCSLAADVFGRVIVKSEHPAERQMGKVGVLSLGFGAGKDRFEEIVWQWDFGPDKELMRPYQANSALIRSIVDVFRNKYYNVKWTWGDYTDRVIPALSARERVYLDRKGLMQTTERGTILLPNGRELRYPRLRWREPTRDEEIMGQRRGQWVFDVRENRRLLETKLYGAKLFENVVQAMARVIVMDQTVRVSTKYRVVHSVYDEIVCCVPEAQAEECEAHLKEVLSTPPAWAPDLPLAAETGIGDFYGGAK